MKFFGLLISLLAVCSSEAGWQEPLADQHFGPLQLHTEGTSVSGEIAVPRGQTFYLGLRNSLGDHGFDSPIAFVAVPQDFLYNNCKIAFQIAIKINGGNCQIESSWSVFQPKNGPFIVNTQGTKSKSEFPLISPIGDLKMRVVDVEQPLNSEQSNPNMSKIAKWTGKIQGGRSFQEAVSLLYSISYSTKSISENLYLPIWEEREKSLIVLQIEKNDRGSGGAR